MSERRKGGELKKTRKGRENVCNCFIYIRYVLLHKHTTQTLRTQTHKHTRTHIEFRINIRSNEIF